MSSGEPQIGGPVERRTGPDRIPVQLIFGLFITAFGVILILGNLDVIQARYWLRLWPTALIAIGALHLIQARGRSGYIAGATWILFGGILLGNRLGILPYDFRDLWPIFLIMLGLALMRRTVGRRMTPDNDQQEVVNAFALMGGVARKSSSAAFRGGDLTAVMGGVDLDLRNARLGGGAVIDTFAFWGGVEIRVPPDWTIVSKVTPIMGGYEDETTPPADSTKVLTIRGTAIMGGVGVKN